MNLLRRLLAMVACLFLRCRAWSLPTTHHRRLWIQLYATYDRSQWKGASHSTSEFVTHVIAGPDSPTVAQAITSVLPQFRPEELKHHPVITTNDNENEHENDENMSLKPIPLDVSALTPSQLLRLGAVWFLPASAPRDPAMGTKPIRLTLSNAPQIMEEGDYLRVHHSPRRFPQVFEYSWTDWHPSLVETPVVHGHKPGVIVARHDDKGFWVVDKPANIPVHPTVDNTLENVANLIRMVRSSEEGVLVGEPNDHVYVTTPQRLDQNTSGLLVVATNKAFASYYAKLLRRKTDQQLWSSSSSSSSSTTSSSLNSTTELIHKKYKCLVCLVPPPESSTPWSVASAMERLVTYAQQQTLIRHYLEPSVRAPKNFAMVPGNETWAECLLRITAVGNVCPLVGHSAGAELALALWHTTDWVPSQCAAVVELEVELLTGRTHQIRGQLSVEGFPLVGDAQYGGAIPHDDISTEYYVHSDKLALQCCQLEFSDPDLIVKFDGTEVAVASDRWNVFRLEESWWTPLIRRYHEQSASSQDALTSKMDAILVKNVVQKSPGDSFSKRRREEERLLPPRVMLAPGVHKYVLVKAVCPSDEECIWFVKSASPSACGGPYHANVAQDLVEWIQAAGYVTTVMGGGRIDYDDESEKAKVYGFSYGFGKGDHALVASIITEWSAGVITATYDNSKSLY